MKKDIIIPKVENIFVAAVQEWNDDFMQKTWYAYLINDSDFKLENVLIVSKASGVIDGEAKKTSLLRHAFVTVEPVSFVKIELMEDSVLVLDNEFMVTFFIDNVLHDKKYIFKAHSLHEDYTVEVPLIFKDGIIMSSPRIAIQD
ncbi:hypothetical protein [Flavobacterium kingsejongi]|uniref:Phenylalanyl-tRNA synthetase subunit alpha n=1 Tax=Flavobacterium kingsejongi TaxID=1678728 RepID=A0A2S1LL10_9FLAO|nr:hypothetical protein [Flavobacterium kingsejongi]AWG24435.1 hypothetical protein FK004_03900 [Flavobacterium kingsejongi]